MGVQEMDAKEMKNIEGGLSPLIYFAVGDLIIAFTIGVYNGYQLLLQESLLT